MVKMKVSLIQVDGKWPNIALMKLSTYHKAKGDKVALNLIGADKVYISAIFAQNRAKVLGLAQFHKILSKEVVIGGSGVNLKTELPSEVENQIPDYSLYGINYSMGFTSRGCPRKCEPCIVPEKEGLIREAPMNWIQHKQAKLFDNNFLASPKWKEKLRYFQEQDIEICMTQAFDIRLVNNEVAKELAETKSRNNAFTRRCYYFAFDYPNLETVIDAKMKILKDYGIAPYCQSYFVLVGFNTTHEQDLRRVQFLHDKGAMAFVMKYHNKDPYLNKLANWCNKRYYKVCKFEDFNKREYRLKQRLAYFH
jgi:radical SAM superfamily enzyme YgiQ (UPF0313 family)